MEIINLLVIIASSAVCIIWAFNKKKELQSLKAQLQEEDAPLNKSDKKTVFEEQEDLNYISVIFQDTILQMLQRIAKITLFCVIFLSLIIWVFLEENLSNFGQSVYFFIGAMSQIFIGIFIFKKQNIYDPRVVMLARVTRWHSLDHIVKINNYITLTNQSLNLIIFSTTYYIATFLGIDLAQNEISERNFEKFHRKFMSYGLGTVFAFFVVKSVSNMFFQGSFMVTEILARQENEGIEEDHPKNPAKIINNISKSFFKIFENALEFNALTNMGLCIFQDFFVTRSVYLLDRGFLNSFAIYSFGMVGSLTAMITFKNSNKLKLSDSNQFIISDKKMKKNCLYSILSAIIISSLGALFIMWNTFPDSIAVYNPFEKKISLRNLNNIDSFIMFLTSSLIVIALIINSLIFTSKNSKTVKAMIESSKICFSLTLLSSDLYAYYATIFPMGIFFFVLYVNYSKGNIYGVTMEYLGIITYFQIIQFYQNFKSICNFTKALIQARNVQSQQAKDNINDIEKICKMFGKFSTGVSLFILIILCFVILVDSFNIQIVKEIIVIEPGYILGIVSGSILFYYLTGMDIKTHQNFLRVLLQKTKSQILRNINDEEYEPPVKELALSLVNETFRNQILVYYLPVLISMGIFFSLFGKKLIVIVMFGCFLLVMLNCYKNLIKGELLMDLQNVYQQQQRLSIKGVDPAYVGLLSNIVAQ